MMDEKHLYKILDKDEKIVVSNLKNQVCNVDEDALTGYNGYTWIANLAVWLIWVGFAFFGYENHIVLLVAMQLLNIVTQQLVGHFYKKKIKNTPDRAGFLMTNRRILKVNSFVLPDYQMMLYKHIKKIVITELDYNNADIVVYADFEMPEVDDESTDTPQKIFLNQVEHHKFLKLLSDKRNNGVEVKYSA